MIITIMSLNNPLKEDQQSSTSGPMAGSSHASVKIALHIRLFAITSAIILLSQSATGFTPTQPFIAGNTIGQSPRQKSGFSAETTWDSRQRTSTELQVRWFGGGSQSTSKSDELLAVKIERTSANSRRIAGEIIVSKSIDDVWAILTDYDNLSIHVPNLVESKRVNPTVTENEQGDGNYKCRLYQKGAQKIIGFEFGASVTMDMTENIRMTNVVTPRAMKLGMEKKIQAGEQRRIYFKCVESPFFSEFDGEWKVSWTPDPNDAFELATKVEYVVDVRPRGPVPVQALEWRIREDVPTNLRAVKAASIELGYDGVMNMKKNLNQRQTSSSSLATVSSTMDNVSIASDPIPVGSNNVVPKNRANFNELKNRKLASAATSTKRNVDAFVNKAASASKNVVAAAQQANANAKLAPVRVQWYDDETMATYLDQSR